MAEARSPGHAKAVAELRQLVNTRRAGATLGDDGVQMTELDEINQSALQASWDGDYASAKLLFEQMLESSMLPATDRGRLHRNVGVMQIYLHDYEGARASFEEAVRVGTPDIQSMAPRVVGATRRQRVGGRHRRRHRPVIKLSPVTETKQRARRTLVGSDPGAA